MHKLIVAVVALSLSWTVAFAQLPPGPPPTQHATWEAYFAGLVAAADASGEWLVATDAALGHWGDDEYVAVEVPGFGRVLIERYYEIRTDILVRMVDLQEARLVEQAGWSSSSWYADMKALYTYRIRAMKHNLARRWPPLDPWPWPGDVCPPTC